MNYGELNLLIKMLYCVARRTNYEHLKPRYILIKSFSFKEEDEIPQSFRQRKQVT